jgi:hypothetical protein
VQGGSLNRCARSAWRAGPRRRGADVESDSASGSVAKRGGRLTLTRGVPASETAGGGELRGPEVGCWAAR